MSEENELLRRVGLLFAEDATSEDIDALVQEVQEWLLQNPGSTVSLSFCSRRPLLVVAMKSGIERLIFSYDPVISTRPSETPYGPFTSTRICRCRSRETRRL